MKKYGMTVVRGSASVMTAMLVCASVACSDSDSNTAPAVATTITANASANGQSGTVGQALATPISVHVADQNETGMAGATVTWAVRAGAGSVSAATSTTDASGDATITWTLGNLMGVDSLTAAIGSGASVVITANATAAGLASLFKVSGDSQSVAAGSATQPLAVKAVDQFGNPVANAAVTWTISDGATLDAATVNTDASGMAHVTVTTGAVAGAFTVTATSGSAPPVVFVVNGT